LLVRSHLHQVLPWLCGAAGVFLVQCANKVPVPDAPQAVAPAPVTVEREPAPLPVEPAPTLSANASYDEALAIPESLDVQDHRAHLSDLQLMNPVRNVPGNCKVPPRAKVTVKIAVREGRAIGVTVLVAFEARPISSKPTSTSKRVNAAAAKADKARAKSEAESRAKTIECFDTAVRALAWPPSARRDSFTTVY
jgi:hypothetical protein